MIYIIDTETTGLTPTDQIIELAYIQIGNDVSNLEPISWFQQYYNPSVPINPRAAAVNGLTKAKLIREPRSSTAKLATDTTIGIFHNAAFDMRMLGNPDIKTICTKKLVKQIEKEQKIKICASHSLRNLFELFYPDLAGDFLTLYHGAEADCKMTLGILIALLKFLPQIETIEQLQRYVK